MSSQAFDGLATNGGPVQSAPEWSMACPVCRGVIGPLPAATNGPQHLVCPRCTASFPCVDGIWYLLPPDRQAHYQTFLTEYTAIRLAERRGSSDPGYYRRLPEPTPGHPLAAQWTIRAATWRHVQRRVLPALGSGSQVLDLGAGVGWLSYRLAELGHRPMAIDLTTDAVDGLGAARHYYPSWPRVQGEFDRLPLADRSVDAVIYNASLHYSVDYRSTLTEACRVLRSGGHLIVLETPVYRHEHSGRAMVEERHRRFADRYGTASASLPSIEYLTDERLRTLAQELRVSWHRTTPWYGWSWWWRPYRARLRRTRAPSRFHVLTARRPEPGLRPPRRSRADPPS